MMVCFEVEINGEKVCTAGVGEFGVLTATVAWVRNRSPNSSEDEPIALNVGGLQENAIGGDEFVDWIKKRVNIGSEIKIRVIDSEVCDEPSERSPMDPAERVERAREYYEELKASAEK